MIKPEGVVNVLQTKLHAVDVSYDRIGDDDERRYGYYAEFDEYKTFALLRSQTQDAANIADVKLMINRIEPVMHVEGNRVECRIRVSIHETLNRRAVENKSLTDFSE